jgi:hypothetical protein
MTTRSAAPVRKRPRRVLLVFLGLLVVAALVSAGVQAYSAHGDRVRAGQFLAAPRCAGSASPASDCSAWLTRTISNVTSDKDGLHLDLSGALHLWYTRRSGWIDGLTAGDSVPVLVWEGSAEALRDPEGHVSYSKDSVLNQGYADIGGATLLCGLALLLAAGAFALSPWFKRRARCVAVAVVLADAGLSGFASGIVIDTVNSVGTGVVVGVILFCVIGPAAPVVWWFRFRRPRKWLPLPADHSGTDR